MLTLCTDNGKDTMHLNFICAVIQFCHVHHNCSVEQVVQAFEQLLKEKESTGGVLLVNPHGAQYKFGPRMMKNSSKL